MPRLRSPSPCDFFGNGCFGRLQYAVCRPSDEICEVWQRSQRGLKSLLADELADSSDGLLGAIWHNQASTAEPRESSAIGG